MWNASSKLIRSYAYLIGINDGSIEPEQAVVLWQTTECYAQNTASALWIMSGTLGGMAPRRSESPYESNASIYREVRYAFSVSRIKWVGGNN